MSKWHGVPEQSRTAWQIAFAEKGGRARITIACPVCGNAELCRYFGTATTTNKSRPGYLGRGASWEWCTACGAYEHASGLVPSWWAPVSLPDESRLTAEPGELERQLKSAGLL